MIIIDNYEYLNIIIIISSSSRSMIGIISISIIQINFRKYRTF